MSYDDDMGHDADVDSGFESGASEPDYDGFYNPYESTSAKPTPGSKALLEEVGVGSRALTGGLLGVDLQLGRDVTGIKGHTDISQYGAGMRGPQAPGVQVDVGIPGVSSVLGPIAPDIGTISFDQTGLGFHSTFDPSQGAFGKAAMNVAKDAIKGASSYYAGGGLASLPQLSHSGLYRALGRG